MQYEWHFVGGFIIGVYVNRNTFEPFTYKHLFTSVNNSISLSNKPFVFNTYGKKMTTESHKTAVLISQGQIFGHYNQLSLIDHTRTCLCH